MAGLIAKIKQFLFGSHQQPRQAASEAAYHAFRDQVFALSPEEIGLSRTDSNSPVWGMLMETGYAEGVVTLLAIGDGTVSIYFSTGGGIIGAGQHAEPRQVAEALLQMSPEFLPEFRPARDHTLPDVDRTKFFLFTFDGILVAEAAEDDLGNDRHTLSPLFHQAHKLITSVREIDEQRKT